MQRPAPLADATIVFDLDGTLVETAPDLMGTLNVLLAREGIAPLSVTEARSLIGQGAKALLARGFAAGGRPLAEPQLSRLFDDFIDHYLAHIADESRPFDGVIAALDRLQSDGARLAICTNKRTDLSIALMSALGLAERFVAIVGADTAPAPKPDARHLTTAIERAGGRADRAVMVGDSASDARAARNAGVPLVLVSFGYTDVPAADLQPDVLIDHFDALPDACARLLGASLKV
ncbi:MAG TPA: HAD-IA family hydrolase [Caulobacteraceae bacterium]|jgi:phosphoglycolate phosphatase|nr:HAD-IA family hydrolase [Caulobacteraceae bacterium]